MKNTLESVAAAVNQISSEKFNLDVFKEAGFFVMRNALPQDVVREWQREWDFFYDGQLRDGRNVNRANPVSLSEQLPEKLATMYKEPVFSNTLKHIFGD